MEAFWGPEVKENPGNTLDGSIRKHPKNLLRKRFLSCSVDQKKKRNSSNGEKHASDNVTISRAGTDLHRYWE